MIPDKWIKDRLWGKWVLIVYRNIILFSFLSNRNSNFKLRNKRSHFLGSFTSTSRFGLWLSKVHNFRGNWLMKESTFFFIPYFKEWLEYGLGWRACEHPSWTIWHHVMVGRAICPSEPESQMVVARAVLPAQALCERVSYCINHCPNLRITIFFLVFKYMVLLSLFPASQLVSPLPWPSSSCLTHLSFLLPLIPLIPLNVNKVMYLLGESSHNSES